MKNFVPQMSRPPPPDLPPGVQPPIRMNFPPPELPPGSYAPPTYGAASTSTSSYYSNYGGASYSGAASQPFAQPGKEKKKKKEKKFNPMGFRPPKHKPESR